MSHNVDIPIIAWWWHYQSYNCYDVLSTHLLIDVQHMYSSNHDEFTGQHSDVMNKCYIVVVGWLQSTQIAIHYVAVLLLRENN